MAPSCSSSQAAAPSGRSRRLLERWNRKRAGVTRVSPTHGSRKLRFSNLTRRVSIATATVAIYVLH